MKIEIPLIIPAYEPDERLIDLVQDIREVQWDSVIIVNDGSSEEYNSIFGKVKEILEPIGGIVLSHEVNMGKGRALKTAFKYVLDNYPEAIGVVTADSDGQHTVECISKIKESLMRNRNALVLGVRDFDADGIPWKSEFGNKLTMRVLQYVSGIKVSDTQTGLRGIPRNFLESLVDLQGERFEYEMRMLLESVGRFPIVEEKIQTIYDSVENHQTHFNPIRDSIKIYKVLGFKFLVYILASLSSSVLDIILFTVFCYLMKESNISLYVALSTIVARVISATYNFMINYKKVFKSEEKFSNSALKYAGLAVLQMTCSAIVTTFLVWLFSGCAEVIIKVVVDTVLFFVSYKIQQKYIF